jgi:hypothetical protein
VELGVVDVVDVGVDVLVELPEEGTEVPGSDPPPPPPPLEPPLPDPPNAPLPEPPPDPPPEDPLLAWVLAGVVAADVVVAAGAWGLSRSAASAAIWTGERPPLPCRITNVATPETIAMSTSAERLKRMSGRRLIASGDLLLQG